jgi:thiol-disulfide isomerase/thioredoxin
MSYLSFCSTVIIHLVTSATMHPLPDSGYTLKGTIAGMHTGKIYLLHAETAMPAAIDSTVTDDQGRFVFEGKTGAAEWCVLTLNPGLEVPRSQKYFFLEKGVLLVNAKKDSLDRAIVSGTVLQEELRAYQEEDRAAIDWDRYYAAHRAAAAKKDKRQLDSVEALLKTMYDRQRQVASQFITAHPHSYASAFALNQRYNYNPDIPELEHLFALLDPEIQQSFFGRNIKQTIAKGTLTGIGRPAPSFSQADADGRPVSLASLKGQYLLLDFWASWCGPCRAENPNVVKAYKRYHPKGFEILGISLDDRKDQWLAAVKKDGLNWKQVSDLKGGYNSAAILYGVQVIPTNYLLDKDGTIIAANLRGDDLEKKLAELLH